MGCWGSGRATWALLQSGTRTEHGARRHPQPIHLVSGLWCPLTALDRQQPSPDHLYHRQPDGSCYPTCPIYYADDLQSSASTLLSPLAPQFRALPWSSFWKIARHHSEVFLNRQATRSSADSRSGLGPKRSRFAPRVSYKPRRSLPNQPQRFHIPPDNEEEAHSYYPSPVHNRATPRASIWWWISAVTVPLWTGSVCQGSPFVVPQRMRRGRFRFCSGDPGQNQEPKDLANWEFVSVSPWRRFSFKV